MSGGECQKVLIAAALAQEPAMVLLDEPTTFLDYKHTVEITALLRCLNREAGLTILAVTHDLSSSVLSGDRVIALKAGALVFDGPPADLVRGELLERIYDTPFAFVAHPVTGLPVPLPREDLP